MRGKILFCLVALVLLLVGVVSADTLLVYAPDTNADARLGVTGKDTPAFTTLRGYDGTVIINTSANTSAIAVVTDSNPYYNTLCGFGWSGDTSSLQDNAIVDSAIFGLYGDTVKQADFAYPFNVTLIAFSPTDPTLLVMNDWQKRNQALKYSSPLEYASWNINGYNNISITNLSAISLTGYTSIMATTGYDAYTQAPGLAASKIARFGLYDTSNTGATKDPFLEITYHVPDTTPPASLANLANVTTCNSINITFTKPADADYNGSMIWWNDAAQPNLTSTDTFKLFTGLTQNTAYTFASKTFDNATPANVNATFTNHTATTLTSVTASFIKNQTAGLQPLSVMFNDTSTGSSVNQWNWSFGDGTWQNGTTRNATKIYSSGGEYLTFLIGSNTCGSNTSASQTINVYNQTIADFTQTDDYVVVPPSQTVSFNTTSTNASWWNWSFGDGTWYNTTDSALSNASFTYDTAGNWTVNLTTSDNGYGENTFLGFVNVYDQIVSDFTVDNVSVCLGETFQFNDTSTGTPDTWYWMFGDTGTSALQNPPYIYENTGVYDVFLNASTLFSFDWENKTSYVTVRDCTPPGSIINLTGTVINCSQIDWAWELPKDGDYDIMMVYQNDTFLYNLTTETADSWTGLGESLSYTFSARTVDTSGNLNETWVNLTKDTTVCPVAPVADFSADNTTVCPFEDVAFTDESTNTPTAWLWAFGDGNASSDQSPTYNWSTMGLFDISLKAGNSAGDNTTTKVDYINVTDCIPPDTIEKLTHIEDCYNITWNWIDPTDADFDHVEIYQDGVYLYDVAAGVETDTWSTLTQNSSYEISTRTVDTFGNIDTDWVNHTVTTDTCVFEPVADFSGTPLDVCMYENVTFTDLSTNSPTIWLWAFGDGGNSYLQNPSYNWSTAGLFDISLKAGNSAGDNSTTKEEYVNVTDCTVPASASFTSNVTCGIVPFSVQFNDTSSGGSITDWYWDFNDGNTSVLQNPTNDYGTVGMYTVNFSVTNSIGTSWSNITSYITARTPGDTCVAGGFAYDTDKFQPNWFTSWWG